jgi:hypothetical protein
MRNIESNKTAFVKWFKHTMGLVGTWGIVSFSIFMIFKVWLVIESNLAKKTSLILNTGIGDIQMTGLMPTLFILFYIITLTIALIIIVLNIQRNSKKRPGGKWGDEKPDFSELHESHIHPLQFPNDLHFSDYLCPIKKNPQFYRG